MKPDFHIQYRPLTSRPFLRGASYSEYAPCGLLAPYVACFWESGVGGADRSPASEVLVVPDTCADLIVEVNHTKGSVSARLCGLAHAPVLVSQARGRESVTTFAARFYFWAVSLFFDMEMKNMRNQVLDFELVDREEFRRFEAFFYMADTRERIEWMENRLLARLFDIMPDRRGNSNLYNSISRILAYPGGLSVKEICAYSCVSQRQMERLFLEHIGMSIKRTANLVRYQKVWRDVVAQERFDARDAVARYGYADQSHLLNEFRRFHGVTPEQARQIALKNR